MTATQEPTQADEQGQAQDKPQSKRMQVLNERPVQLDGFVQEWPEVGYIAMHSPSDPAPSLRVEDGQIVELDGKSREEFDSIDQFLADYAIDVSQAEQAMAMDEREIAMMLVDPHVSRGEVLSVAGGMTPAKFAAVFNTMNVVEMMQGLQKMRARRTPSIQAHSTSVTDNPVQIAADAAEGALRGFDEFETTLGVVRYAPLAALAILVGSNTGRGGVLTQCALEESTELDLGLRALTTYAETISVYGNDTVFDFGDDTPWSKSFLASTYASRGIKMRFTSGSGSEVQMGYAEGKSMLYLEVRCVMITKGAGVQGLQNGSISAVAVPGAVPAGVRCMLAENLCTSMLDLECASGNDQSFSHSDMRRMARLFPQLTAGTDLIVSGYSAVPNYDNMFAGSNTDPEDYDDWNIIQRDLQVDGGLRPVGEDERLGVRNKAVRALQAIFADFGYPAITEEEVEAATYGHGSRDLPERDVTEDLKAAQSLLDNNITGLDVVRALDEAGFTDVADSLLGLFKSRVSGDLLQTSAILDHDLVARSAVNDPNDYAGPGTGYRLEGERWEELKHIRQAISSDDV